MILRVGETEPLSPVWENKAKQSIVRSSNFKKC
jgi:hypothetical protein